jgi:regulator of RNase E activity RraA
VYSKGRTVHHCALRFRAINQPIEIGGIAVHPGDVIHANVDGVIKIPKACLPELGGHAARMYAFERDAHQVLRQPGVAAAAKRAQVLDLLARHGFAKP